jgi:endonuclease IV
MCESRKEIIKTYIDEDGCDIMLHASYSFHHHSSRKEKLNKQRRLFQNYMYICEYIFLLNNSSHKQEQKEQI